MAKADFSTYLNVDMKDVPQSIPTLPLGHYFAEIAGWKPDERDYNKATGGAKTPVVELSFRVTGADDDIDPDTLPAGYIGRTLTKDYTLNDPDKTGQVMLRRLAEKTCGLDVKGLHLQDVLDALVHQPVKVYNEPRPGKEEGQFFANIKQVLPAA